MKTKRIRSLSILLVLILAQAIVWAAGSTIIKTVASTGTPEVLGDGSQVFKTIVFVGNKSARTNNTTDVWIQTSLTNNAGGIRIIPGGTFSLTSAGGFFSTSDFWIDVETNGDGIVCLLY